MKTERVTYLNAHEDSKILAMFFDESSNPRMKKIMDAISKNSKTSHIFERATSREGSGHGSMEVLLSQGVRNNKP